LSASAVGSTWSILYAHRSISPYARAIVVGAAVPEIATVACPIALRNFGNNEAVFRVSSLS
jgi:hypothetical protein